MTWGTGFVPDRHATHDGDARAMLASLSPARRPASYLAAIGGVRDQGQTSTCVGFAFASAIALRCAALGLDVPRGSELAIRNMALELEAELDGTSAAPLVDNGCQPSLAVQGIRTFGLPSEAAFPFDTAHLTDKVTLSELEDADKRVGLFVRQFRGITATGDDRIAHVRQALDAGLPVVLAVRASTSAFQGCGPDDVLTAWQGPTDHMVQLIDYSDDWFTLLNSWGPWANGGLATVDRPFVGCADHLFIVDIGATP